jgi:hypothetical protein
MKKLSVILASMVLFAGISFASPSVKQDKKADKKEKKEKKADKKEKKADKKADKAAADKK